MMFYNRFDNNEDKAVGGEDERYRVVEAGCWGEQGSPRAVAPRRRTI